MARRARLAKVSQEEGENKGVACCSPREAACTRARRRAADRRGQSAASPDPPFVIPSAKKVEDEWRRRRMMAGTGVGGVGGAGMLRTRRRDVSVKPNRKLDRKSSRGMIYENEELRLRTIHINAEVEQGKERGEIKRGNSHGFIDGSEGIEIGYAGKKERKNERKIATKCECVVMKERYNVAIILPLVRLDCAQLKIYL